MGLALRGGAIRNRQGEIFDARSDQITTRIFKVVELIFPPDFIEKKMVGEDPLDPLIRALSELPFEEH
jgi:hypothetical protein